MGNLMEGIKENEVLTKILAAKITNETNKLQERFQKMTALYGEQIEKSQYVERYLGKLLSSIALLLTGKISPLLIPPKEMERTLNCVQGHLTPLGYQVLRQTPQYYYEFGIFSIMRRNLSIFISVKGIQAVIIDLFYILLKVANIRCFILIGVEIFHNIIRK
jgi:hypothetical protein